MKIVYAITYYAPHLSGLTLPVVRMAEEMAQRGHEVHVICARHSSDLPLTEQCGGVRVHRVPVWAFLGKGPVMPGFASAVWRVVAAADVLHVIAPQADAGGATIVARLRGVPVVMSYVCSFEGRGVAGALVTGVLRLSHLVSGFLSRKIIVLSEDYAGQSRFCRLFRSRLVAIPVPLPSYPAVALPWQPAVPPYRLGFVGRIAPEKGLDVLLDALVLLRDQLHSPFTVSLVGQRDDPRAPGMVSLSSKLEDARRDGLVEFPGRLSDAELDVFYRDIDVLILPSNDRVEAYGLVQVEAMLRGTPALASDRPGMRLPVLDTGFGQLFAPGDARALAQALTDLLHNGPPRVPEPAELHAHFDPAPVLLEIEELYDLVMR